MDIFDAIKGRRSIRKFKDTPVKDSDIIAIIDAARKAPSPGNSQPWHFIAVKNKPLMKKMAESVKKATDQLIQWSNDEKAKKKLENYKKSYYTLFENAPVTIVVLTEPYTSDTEIILKEQGFNQDEILLRRPLPGLQGVSAAIQNLILAAHAHGYGTCWMTGPVIAVHEIINMLNIIPPKYPIALIPIGIPDESPAERPRKGIEEIMTIIE